MLWNPAVFEGECPCGREHPAVTMRAETGEVRELPAFVADFAGDILIITDENTRAVIGAAAEDALKAAGRNVTGLIFEQHPFHPDERHLGAAMAAAEHNQVIIAAGSGTLHDIARRVAYLQGEKPFVSLPTAASMDGYTSTVSPLTVRGFKRTFQAAPPVAMLADLPAVFTAPKHMTSAGIGDMAGKITARLDWVLAHISEEEYYCARTADVVANATNDALSAALQLNDNPDAAMEKLLGGLSVSGIAMQRVGNSRPASGCEHHVAHFWEMRDALLGRPETLHGARVGIATLLVLKLYEKFFEKPQPFTGVPFAGDLNAVFGPITPMILDEAGTAEYRAPEIEREAILANFNMLSARVKAAVNRADEIGRALCVSGGPTHPMDLGYDREETRLALLYAADVRQRFTLLRLMNRWGCLESVVNAVIEDVFA